MSAHDPSKDPHRTLDHVPLDGVPDLETVNVSQEPSTDKTAPHHVSPPLDTPLISGYRVISEIAKGGMGRVFSGIDTKLDREVAIKTLLPGADSERFITEAKLTAKLPHPNIPPVYASGTLDDNTPWLAMKLIRGRTLADMLNQRLPGQPELSRYIQIFEHIAQGVGFAHSRGIIHRDLKPLNVMVGEFGEVQVMDWGLAKDLRCEIVHDDAFAHLDYRQNSIQQTAVGSVMGTPGYMAPEQARGEVVDERSDVFSLGSILATILTGKPAFTGRSRMEVISKSAAADLAEVEARLASSGADSELATLALRCMAAQANQRPVDAREVAIEVASYRARVEAKLKQVESARTRAETQAAEYQKRKLVIQRSAIALSTVLIVGLTVSLWQMTRAINAERQASENEAKAISERDLKEQARARAEKNEVLANEARNRAEREKANAVAVRDFLRNNLIRRSSVWEQVNVANSNKSEPNNPRHDITIRELLDQAAIEFGAEKINAKFPDQPEVQAEILDTIGEAYEATGDFPKAVKFIKEATELREKCFGANNFVTLASKVNQLFVCLNASEEPQAISLAIQVLSRLDELAKANVPGKPGDAAEIAIDAVIEALERRMDLRQYSLPTIEIGLAEGAMILLQVGQALPKIRSLIANAEKRFGPEDKRMIYFRLMLGFQYHAMGNLESALDIYQTVLDNAEQHFASKDLRLVVFQWIVAVTHSSLGLDTKENIDLFLKTYEVLNEELGPEHPATETGRSNLATAYYAAGEYTTALPLLEEILQISERKFGSSHPITLSHRNNLGDTYSAARQLDKALPILESTLQARREKLGENHPDTIISLNNLAGAYAVAGDLEKAIPLFQKALNSSEAQLGENNLDTTLIRHNLANALHLAGDHVTAVPLLELTFKARERKLGAYHPHTIISRNDLAHAYNVVGRSNDALRLHEDAAARLEKLDYKHGNAGRVIANTIIAYEKSQQFDKADEWQEKWLMHLKRSKGPESPEFADELSAQGGSLLARQSWPKAEKVLRECLTIRQRLQPNRWTTFNTMSRLGAALAGQGKYSEAEQLVVQGYEGLMLHQASIPDYAAKYIPDALDLVVDVCIALGKDEQVQRYRKLREKYPDNEENN